MAVEEPAVCAALTFKNRYCIIKLLFIVRTGGGSSAAVVWEGGGPVDDCDGLGNIA